MSPAPRSRRYPYSAIAEVEDAIAGLDACGEDLAVMADAARDATTARILTLHEQRVRRAIRLLASLRDEMRAGPR